MEIRQVLGRPIWLMALAIAGLALVAAACGGGEEKAPTPRPASPGAAAPVSGPIAIEQGDNFFVFQGQRNPDITIKGGQEITVNIENKGQAIHNMRIAGLDDRFDTGDDTVSNPDAMRAGAKGSLKFKVDKAGGYKFRCDFHPDEMTGTITVVQ